MPNEVSVFSTQNLVTQELLLSFHHSCWCPWAPRWALKTAGLGDRCLPRKVGVFLEWKRWRPPPSKLLWLWGLSGKDVGKRITIFLLEYIYMYVYMCVCVNKQQQQNPNNKKQNSKMPPAMFFVSWVPSVLHSSSLRQQMGRKVPEREKGKNQKSLISNITFPFLIKKACKQINLSP